MLKYTVKKSFKVIKPINYKTIHNQSYIVLSKELDDKVKLIKELKDYIKKLECQNYSLTQTIKKNDYQNMINNTYKNYTISKYF